MSQNAISVLLKSLRRYDRLCAVSIEHRLTNSNAACMSRTTTLTSRFFAETRYSLCIRQLSVLAQSSFPKHAPGYGTVL